MSKHRRTAFVGLIIMAFLMTSFSHALAATMKFRIVMFLKKAEIIKVEDVEDHIIGVGENTGLASLESGEVAVVTSHGFVDYINRDRNYPGIRPTDLRG